MSEPPAPDLAAARTAAERLSPPAQLEDALARAEAGPIRRRATSPFGWFRNVRLARRVSLRALQASDVTVEAEEARVPTCEGCPNSCCRGPGTGISLRLADVARLVDAGLGWAVAKTQSWEDDHYARDPALREHEARDSQRRFPSLRRRADGACVFLDEAERCAIHSIRPLACRAFPYRLDETRTRVHFSGRCASSRADGQAADVDEMVGAVLELYNAKVRDLVVLTHGRRELRRLGLSRYLPVVE
jgi:Fe-S-cluster containining protein